MRVPLLTVVGLLTIVGIAAAQDIPRVELSGSYQFLRPMCPGLSCYTYPGGWQVSVATHVAGWFTLVGEAGESLRTISTSTTGPLALTGTTGTLIDQSDIRLRIYDVLVGPRATIQVAHARVFGELLFGVSYSTFQNSFSFSIPEEDAHVGDSFSDSARDWAWQPRIGVDIPFASRWSSRAGVGYRMVGASPKSLNHGDVLVDTGIAFRIH